MNDLLKQLIADKVIIYYPSIDSKQSKEYTEININNLCKSALHDTDLQDKWYRFKDNTSKQFKNYTLSTFDTELINGAPCFRYGLQTHDNSFQLTTFSFYISIMMPVFSWLFIDREKYPKNRNGNKFQLGPPKNVFYQFGLEQDYAKLNNNEIKSVLDLQLAPNKLLDFLSPHPRFNHINDEELRIVKILINELYSTFGHYSYIDYETGNIEAKHLVPKSISPLKYYTYFDCLFTKDLGYT